MLQEPKFNQNLNGTKTELSPKLKFYKNRNVTKNLITAELKGHQN